MTGAGRGVGQATAFGLARHGARVALLARSVDELNRTAAQVNELGGTALVVAADLREPGQVSGAVQRIADELGVVDVLVNNAAVVWPLAASVSLDPGEWATAIAINVTAPATLSFALLPAMLARGWGRIVNVSSGIAAHPAGMVRANAYVTSKAALEAHTLNLAAEIAGSGVTVNVFRPGSVDTAMQAWVRGQDPDRIGTDLHQRFLHSHEQGSLITADQSAASLLTQLQTSDTGQIWNATART